MDKKVMVMGVCLLSILSFFSGCVDIPDDLTRFSIVSFDVEPSIITEGEYANLSWSVINTDTVNIDNGIGSVALTGHRMIQPDQTTTYTLTASNATTTKNVTATIIVKPSQQIPQNGQTITDGINDVSSIDYLTSGTTVVTSNPFIDVENIDIVKATYTQQGTQATVTLQVRGSIENRGKSFEQLGEELGPFNFVEYDFQVTTSEQDYTISYANQSGQINNGIDSVNLTYSDFTVAGDTLTIIFSLKSAVETYSKLSVTSMYVKQNFAGEEPDLTTFVYLSDIAPNPALEIMQAYAPNIGAVGDTIQFNGSIIPLTGQPPYQYHWDFGDGRTSTQLNPTHIYTHAGHFTYTFTVTDQANDAASETGIITISSEEGQTQTPNIACTTDSTTNRITVATTDANVKWRDIVITINPGEGTWQVFSVYGNVLAPIGDTASISTDVTAGEYILLSGTTGNVMVTLKYTPTNALLGTWTVNV